MGGFEGCWGVEQDGEEGMESNQGQRVKSGEAD